MLKERYVIRRIIGSGGMGSIYLAEDNRLPGRLCAIKQVKQESALPEALRKQGREQFYREASVLARLDHPNLPKVSDFFSEGKLDYLVMDYVPGEDLKTLMDQARRQDKFLPVSDVLAWADQLLDALEYLHRQETPVIHRDIKPSNLKLTPSGLLKLVDFGLVKQMIPDEMTVTVIQGRGTAYYTPLEQYGGDHGHTDPRSDIYSFGATLYHLLTNHPPAEAKHRFLRPEALKAPRSLNPDIPQRIERILLWTLALHPDDRPTDITALRSRLLGEGHPIPNQYAPETPRSDAPFLASTADRGLAFLAFALLILASVLSLR